MLSRIFVVLAWLLLAAVAFVTLSPLGFRPITSAPPNLERFMAFALLGLVFALAYPRHLLMVGALVVGAAISLELLQAIAIDRHPRLIDMGFKLLGGLVGVGIGAAVALQERFQEKLQTFPVRKRDNTSA